MVVMTATSRWSSTADEDRAAPGRLGFAPGGAGPPGARRPLRLLRSGPVSTGTGSSGSVWLERRVIAYAHQGGAWEGPSSTMHAIEHALKAGATGIELDVHATADGELVVCH